MREEAADWFRLRLGASLPTPPGRTAHGPKRDPLSMMPLRPPPNAVQLRGLVLWLGYADEEEEETERAVRCSRAWIRDDRPYLTAWCELRREPRMFRIDRIRVLVDPQTGEILQAMPFFLALGLAPADPHWLAFLAAAHRGLVVLAAVATADGHFVSDELEAVYRWADRLADHFQIDLDDKLMDVISRSARLMRPDADAAIEAMHEIVDATERRILVRSIRDLAHSDDMFTWEEHRLLELLGLDQ